MNAEAMDFAEKLIRRTDEGKLPWKETADENTFICVLDAVIMFEVRSLSNGYVFEMKDELNSIFSSRVYTPSNSTTSQDDQLYEVLARLYEKARRAALNIDQKVKRASKLLDEL